MTRAKQITAFLEHAGYADAVLTPLAGDASFRRYIRLQKGDQSYMLMDAPPEKEDVRPYVAIAEYLHRCNYSAPAILARDIEQGFLLLEDLGDDTFTRLLRQAPKDHKKAQERTFYEAAIDVLANWHCCETRLADPQTLPLPLYDNTLLMREVALFADWFLPQVIGKERASELHGDYMALWYELIHKVPLATDQFVHRDYHADNLMWLPARSGVARVGLLDFQDGVYGDGAYDLVSLLEDARRDVPHELVQAMTARYVAATGVDQEAFAATYSLLGAQRNSKIVGIFVRLCARDGKAGYLDYLPRVWEHLERDLAHPVLAPLRAWMDKHVPRDARGVITIAYDARALALSA